MQIPHEDLSPAYSPVSVEERWYGFWESQGYFSPSIQRKKKPYTIVIPPPNVTGILHMGHALNNTLQDILIRWQRMRGVPTLWVPGTDHAGIATQNVVEKKLAREGKTRFELGREKFVEEVWKWKEEYGSTIVKQLRKLGSSCDWTRERFTMDKGLSRAVRHAFVDLYERKLIYQADYIINWCPRCQTALSDEEAPYSEVDGKLYYYHYLSKDSRTGKLLKDKDVVIATTRPETMLGDTAVALNPADKRFRELSQREIYVPLQNRRLRVIQDDLIDTEFGTGIVKVTPAHDPNDFTMGHRHGLEFRNVFHPDARVNENGTPYQGLDRFEARRRILEDLVSQGLFVKEEPHHHKVPHCYRCHTVVEPYLSKQWFVRMKPLAERAIRAHKQGKVKFFPPRWTKVYLHWLKNIRDWCISRQIWWGHQIPVWYCRFCRAKGKDGLIVSREDVSKCPECGSGELVRDPDVLDTWFSSWLWPFSTLGWPGETKDLAYFYPTSALATAQEIIFFWVARMIMAGLHFMKEVPFRHVYIHGTVRTDAGQKMSKSLGNAIDPLELIGEIGADALRFSIIMLTASGQDAFLSKEKFDIGRNFTNKIWNASRFSLMNLKGFKAEKPGRLPPKKSMIVTDTWIVSALQQLTADMNLALERYRFNDAASALYHFFWHDFCDWYLELCKLVLQGPDERQKKATLQVLLYVLETSLRLLHPLMPFISEEIWQRLRGHFGSPHALPPSIMMASWPKVDRALICPEADRKVKLMREAVVGIRDLRAKINIPPAKAVQVSIRLKSPSARKNLEALAPSIQHLARLEKLDIVNRFEHRDGVVSNALGSMEVFLRTEGVVDLEVERQRIRKKIEETRLRIEPMKLRLRNEDFVKRAPQEVVEREKVKLGELQSLVSDLEQNLTLLGKTG